MIVVFDMNTQFESSWANIFLEVILHIKIMFFSGKQSSKAQNMDGLLLQNDVDSLVQQFRYSEFHFKEHANALKLAAAGSTGKSQKKSTRSSSVNATRGKHLIHKSLVNWYNYSNSNFPLLKVIYLIKMLSCLKENEIAFLI